MAVPIRYKGAIKLQRDRTFSEFLTPLGAPTNLLAKAQYNLGIGPAPQSGGVYGYRGILDVTLTPTQIKAMNGAPITLLPAVTGQSYVLDDPILFRYTFGTAAYTSGGAVVIQYHTGAIAATGTVAAAQLGASSNENVVQTVSSNLTPTIGDSIEITNGTGAFVGATSTGTLRVVMPYILI